MLGGDLMLCRVEAEPLAGNFKPPADHPGNRSGSGLPFAPCRVVILAAAGVADELEDVVVAVGEILLEPFAEQIADFKRQAQRFIRWRKRRGT